MEKLKWYKFDKAKGSRQKRPPIKKYVMVLCESLDISLPHPICHGYRKNAAGDKQCPYFVTPGVTRGEVIAWCDCLPGNFEYPLELAKKST